MEKNSNKNGVATAKNGATTSADAKAAGQILIVRPSHGKTEPPKVEPAKVETESKTEPPKVEPPQPVTLTSQRDKTEKLNLLFEREEKLSSTKKEIDRFKIATDESTNSLELRDGKGASFRTSNPMLIKSVIDLVVQELTVRQAHIANEIIAVG
jgi:hypothetical protein